MSETKTMWWYDAVDGRVSADRAAFRALLAERDALREQIAALAAALEWYADPANWDEDGYAMDNLRGGYHTVDEWVDFDFDLDMGKRAQAALAANPAPATEV